MTRLFTASHTVAIQNHLSPFLRSLTRYLRIIAVYSSVVKLIYIALPLSCTYYTTRTQQNYNLYLITHVRTIAYYTCEYFLTVASTPRGSAHCCFGNHHSYILLHQRSSHNTKAQKKNISRISVSNRTCDLQPIWTINICQSSIHGSCSSSMLTAIPHRYIHLKGILVPASVDNKTH